MWRVFGYIFILLVLSSSAFSGSGYLTGISGSGSGGPVDENDILWGNGPDQISLDDIPDGFFVRLGQDASPTGTPTFDSINLTNGLEISSGGTSATNAADARFNLGLGSLAVQEESSVSISGGSIAGITDLAIEDGGTSASTALDARTNLGAAAAGNNSDINELTGLTTPLSINQGGTGANTVNGARLSLMAALLGDNSDITSLLGLSGAIQAPTQINDSSGNEVLIFGSAGSAVNELTITNAATGNGPTVSVSGDDIDADLNLVPLGSGSVVIPSATISGGSISGIADLAITDGGTGASNASDARANLMAASSGTNSDITELTGLTIPLSVQQGGTATLTQPTGGQLLIGRNDGTYDVATLTAGSNVTIMEGDGIITIAAAGGGGSTDPTPGMPGQTINCGFAKTGSTISILGSDGTDLSVGSPCLVALRSANPSQVMVASFEANIDFTDGAASDTDGNLFGIAEADWSEAMPMFFGVINNGVDAHFTMSRLPIPLSPSASSGLCQLGDTDCDEQTDLMILSSGLTLSDWTSLPVEQVAWQEASYNTATSSWTIDGNVTTGTGFNRQFENLWFSMPQGQNGGGAGPAVTGSHLMLILAVSVPQCDTETYHYQINESGWIRINSQCVDDAGTDGDDGNLFLTVPFAKEDNLVSWSMGQARLITPTYQQYATCYITGGQQSIGFHRNDSFTSIDSVGNSDFGNGLRRIICDLAYPADLSS